MTADRWTTAARSLDATEILVVRYEVDGTEYAAPPSSRDDRSRYGFPARWESTTAVRDGRGVVFAIDGHRIAVSPNSKVWTR
jgi:hypothetical protein